MTAVYKSQCPVCMQFADDRCVHARLELSHAAQSRAASLVCYEVGIITVQYLWFAQDKVGACAGQNRFSWTTTFA